MPRVAQDVIGRATETAVARLDWREMRHRTPE
jgi:hypothetical protein